MRGEVTIHGRSRRSVVREFAHVQVAWRSTLGEGWELTLFRNDLEWERWAFVALVQRDRLPLTMLSIGADTLSELGWSGDPPIDMVARGVPWAAVQAAICRARGELEC